jgi:DNA polymerase III subunit epsilon
MAPIKITGLDLETTGLHQEKGDRIIEVAMIEVEYKPGERLVVKRKFVSRVNPHRVIHADAYAVHKISDADVASAPEWADVAPKVIQMLKSTNLLVAHNMPFDGPFLAGELLRIGLVPPDVPTFCTMENGRWSTPTGKLPKLSELCFASRVKYDPALAHAAEYDVLQTFRCLLFGLNTNFFKLPSEVLNGNAS